MNMRQKYFVVASCLSTVLACSSFANGQGSAAKSDVEDVYILRSIRLSRTDPTDFCSQSRTTFAGSRSEDRFSFVPVTTDSKSGMVRGIDGVATATLRACFGSTDRPETVNFYGEGELRGVRFTGRGTCSTLKNDFPETGIRLVQCFLDLTVADKDYVGGLLTSSTIISRQLVGTTSDPPGYSQASIATVRLWRRRVSNNKRDGKL